eukprot:Gb_35394 [translate_table: standard]
MKGVGQALRELVDSFHQINANQQRNRNHQENNQEVTERVENPPLDEDYSPLRRNRKKKTRCHQALERDRDHDRNNLNGIWKEYQRLEEACRKCARNHRGTVRPGELQYQKPRLETPKFNKKRDGVKVMTTIHKLNQYFRWNPMDEDDKITGSLTNKPRCFQLNDKKRSEGEMVVKKLFVNDMIDNYHLFNILLEKQATCDAILLDSAQISNSSLIFPAPNDIILACKNEGSRAESLLEMKKKLTYDLKDLASFQESLRDLLPTDYKVVDKQQKNNLGVRFSPIEPIFLEALPKELKTENFWPLFLWPGESNIIELEPNIGQIPLNAQNCGLRPAEASCSPFNVSQAGSGQYPFHELHQPNRGFCSEQDGKSQLNVYFQTTGLSEYGNGETAKLPHGQGWNELVRQSKNVDTIGNGCDERHDVNSPTWTEAPKESLPSSLSQIEGQEGFKVEKGTAAAKIWARLALGQGPSVLEYLFLDSFLEGVSASDSLQTWIRCIKACNHGRDSVTKTVKEKAVNIDDVVMKHVQRTAEKWGEI